MTWRIEWLDEVGSTNDLALSRLAAGTGRVGDVLAARRQTAGRGRGSRSWHSPEGGLFMSAVLPLPGLTGWAALGAGMAVARAARELGAPARVKWPNDVLIEGRKLAGVLVETRGGPAIVGIGLNVHPAARPQSLRNVADLQEYAPGITVEASLVAVLAHLGESWELLLNGDLPALVERWDALDALRGAPVTWRPGPADCPDAPRRRGVAEGVDATGALRLRLPGGSLELLTAGDVSQLL